MNCVRVKVRFIASHLQTLVGVDEDEFEVCGTLVTLKELLSKLLEKHGYTLYEQLYDNERGDFRSGVIILVNNRVVQKPGETLRNGDVVTITITYEGG